VFVCVCAHFGHRLLKFVAEKNILNNICREEGEIWVSHDGVDKD